MLCLHVGIQERLCSKMQAITVLLIVNYCKIYKPNNDTTLQLKFSVKLNLLLSRRFLVYSKPDVYYIYD